jgi:hypothetical protein
MANCRFCNSKLEQSFVNLGLTPLANSFLTEDAINKKEHMFPLHALLCTKCYLVQLEEFETPKNIFTNYVYFSSYSKSFVNHAKNYVDLVIDRFNIDKSSFVVEIASNDGYLLQFFKDNNIPLLGIEPAENVAEIARNKGIDTMSDFFGKTFAEKFTNEHKKANLIICNNVLAHVPQINDFVKGLKILLSKTGVITIEFPHLMELIQHNQFDTIYHEHFSYFSFFVIKKILETNNLKIFDVEKIPTHGGSLRLYCTHLENKKFEINNSVSDLLKSEEQIGMNNIEYYQNFSKIVSNTINEFTKFCYNLKKEGKTIVGYGAPAKANTLLNCCNLTSDTIDYVVDLSPHKQKLYLPGSHIHIKSPDMIKKSKPDYVLILPWNIKDEIMQQMSFIREWGGKFIVPIPEVKIF